MKAPTVTPYRIEPNPSYPGYTLVHIVCPHCGREHAHGGSPDGYVGYRAAHCHSPIGYVITAATKAKTAGMEPGMRMQRQERERIQGVKRDANRILNFLDGIHAAMYLSQHPARDEVLNQIDPVRRALFLRIEEAIAWPSEEALSTRIAGGERP